MSEPSVTQPTTATAQTQQSIVVPAPTAGPPVALDFATVQGFEGVQRLAKALAMSSMVPRAYQGAVGSEGYCNTIVALELAQRLRFPPLLVMQNLFLVDGKSGWAGKFYTALVNAPHSKFRDLDWEERGDLSNFDDDSAGVRAKAVRISDGKVCYGTWITWKLVKAEGWLGKKGSKWQSMPEQMFAYRSVSFWAAKWYPEATLGLPSVEELEDIRVEQPIGLSAPPSPVRVERQMVATPPGLADERQIVDTEVVTAEQPGVEPISEDRSLEPGIDPIAMEDDLGPLRAALANKAWGVALGIIGRLPRDSQVGAKTLYNDAKRKAQP